MFHGGQNCHTVHSDFMVQMKQSKGATSSSFRGGAIFMKFHSMTSSWLFNRDANFSQTVTESFLHNISENENISVKSRYRPNNRDTGMSGYI